MLYQVIAENIGVVFGPQGSSNI